MTALNKLLRRAFIHVTLLLGKAFFDGRYLTSTHFTHSTKGGWWLLRSIWHQALGRSNHQLNWPVSHYNTVIGPAENIVFDPSNIDNFQGKGCYFQCENARIVIGKGTLIANNVGIITANHNPDKIEEHLEAADVIIGEACWIGMNSVLLPGVTLGNGTVVGAGSVVTHSFPEGRCVVAGNPARIIRTMGDR